METWDTPAITDSDVDDCLSKLLFEIYDSEKLK